MIPFHKERKWYVTAQGTLENGKQVSVKRLKDSKRNIHELDREISIVSDLRHKNLPTW